MNGPSSETRATPVPTPRSPIHRSDVPVKVKVALPPAVTLCLAFSPLHKLDWPLGVQSLVKATDRSVSCTRVTLGVRSGTASNASTITQAADDAGFFTPGTSILKVWLPAARPVAVNTGTWTTLVGE